MTELIDQYDDEGVHGCCVFTFAMPDFPHRDDPRMDLDKAVAQRYATISMRTHRRVDAE